MTTTTIPSFAALVAVARRIPAATAAEFDYSLAFGGRIHDDVDAWTAFNMAAGALAGEQISQAGAAHHALAQQILDAHRPAMQAMAAEAKTKKYLGWSDAARAMGHQIRYAR